MIALLAAAMLAAPILPFEVTSYDEPMTLALNTLASPGHFSSDESSEDALEETLFEPDFIVDHQKTIALEEKQRNGIIDEIAKAQADIVRGRWKLQAATRELKSLLKNDRVDEAKSLAKADEVMNLERDVKRANLAMLIRVKNQLTAAQQKKLAAIRDGDEDDENDENDNFSQEAERLRERAMRKAMKGMREHEAPVPPVPPVPAAPPAKK